jgi:hypothetical protein
MRRDDAFGYSNDDDDDYGDEDNDDDYDYNDNEDDDDVGNDADLNRWPVLVRICPTPSIAYDVPL